MSIAIDQTTGVLLLASLSFRLQPHKRGEVLSAVDETIVRMRGATGCTRTRLLADTDDPNAFTIHSEWQSPESAAAFFASREFQLFRGLRMLLRDEPFIVMDDVRSRVTRLVRTP